MKYIKKREVIERVTLVFPADKRAAVFDALRAGNWHVTRTGPYTSARLGPGKIDSSRGLIIAERPVKETP